jgi:PAS domain S-box-containing protein
MCSLVPRTRHASYQSVVNAGGHWLGLLQAGKFYTRTAESLQAIYAATLQEKNSLAHRSWLSLPHQQQEGLALALKGAKMGIWDWDLSGGAILISEELERLLGIKPGEFDGRYDSLFKAIHPEDSEAVHHALLEAIRLGEHYNIEFRVLGSQGKVRWLSSRGQVFDDDDHPPRLVGVTLDISHQKQAEEELKSSDPARTAGGRNRPAHSQRAEAGKHSGTNGGFRQVIHRSRPGNHHSMRRRYER